MTNKEMTEIFAVMRLNYRNAKMFEGGIETLAPTIRLWTTALPEIDYWTGQRALFKLLRTCKYPPTIAEFHEAAEQVTQELNTKINGIFSAIRSGELMHGSLDAYYASLDPTGEVKAVIDRMGGTQNLVREVKDGYAWNLDAILRTARDVIKSNMKMLGGDMQALPGGRKELQ